jgi:hypothetical protein
MTASDPTAFVSKKCVDGIGNGRDFGVRWHLNFWESDLEVWISMGSANIDRNNSRDEAKNKRSVELPRSHACSGEGDMKRMV